MNFKVTVDPSGHRFSVNAQESVLAAALRSGLAFPYGCRNGVCGACKGKVVQGEVHYPQLQPAALSETEAAIGQALFCCAVPKSDLVLEVHEIAASSELPIRKMPARVERLEPLAEDVMRLFLKLPEGERMQFLAGQYIDIVLPDGRHRSFSIANAPHDDALLELHVRRIAGGRFTGHVFSEMKEKDILRIEGPFGRFYLREDSPRPLLFLAGGTGFAPIKGIIEHALAEGVDRAMTLYWGARDKQDLYLDGLARQWSAAAGFEYIPVLSAPRPDDGWSGRTGYVHQAVLDDVADVNGYDVYISGPPEMVDAARQAFFDRGLPEDQLYFDSFEFAGDSAGDDVTS